MDSHNHRIPLYRNVPLTSSQPFWNKYVWSWLESIHICAMFRYNKWESWYFNCSDYHLNASTWHKIHLHCNHCLTVNQSVLRCFSFIRQKEYVCEDAMFLFIKINTNNTFFQLLSFFTFESKPKSKSNEFLNLLYLPNVESVQAR